MLNIWYSKFIFVAFCIIICNIINLIGDNNMLKKFLILLLVNVLFSSFNSTFASQDAVHHIKKNHNLSVFGKGGYSSAEEAHQFYTNALNDAKNAASVGKNFEQAPEMNQDSEKEVSNFIKNDTGIDDDYPYLDNSAGVNDSKTIYTDNLGRIHFFGKKNLIRY